MNGSRLTGKTICLFFSLCACVLHSSGSSLKVSWSTQLANEATAAAGASLAASPISSPTGRQSQLLQRRYVGVQGAASGGVNVVAADTADQSTNYSAALDSLLQAGGRGEGAAAAAAAAGAAVESDEEALRSRPWSGLQPTPHSSNTSPSAVAAAGAAAAVLSRSATASTSEAASPGNDRAALIAAVLGRQWSKANPGGAATRSPSETMQQQQQQPQMGINIGDSNSRSSSATFGAPSDTTTTAGAAMASAAARPDGPVISAGQDRASLIAAVLQRQKAKHAEDVSSSFVFAGAGDSARNSCSGATGAATAAGGSLSSGSVAVASRVGSLSGGASFDTSTALLHSPSGAGGAGAVGTLAGKDRASIVAAVLAQRQQKQQQQAAAVQQSVADVTSPSSALAAAASVSGNGGSAARALVTAPADRAALVAAVLAKHHLGGK